MINGLITKVFGTAHERYIKRIRPLVTEIEDAGKALFALNDKALVEKTVEFKKRIAEGDTLDEILVEAFAVCREACDRRLGMLNILREEFGFNAVDLGAELQGEINRAKELLRTGECPEWQVYLSAEFYAKVRELYPESVRPFRMRSFPVQMIGGVVLHRGRIAEMATGEGKTLSAAGPVYLNALSGKGVHVVTVNDYLARRDSETIGAAYKFLGLSVGLIVPDLPSDIRREAYGSDITYGTNNEFGFDYLRDNMAVEKEQLVQRELNFCIVDEVDSILVDEARTPLIISGPAEDSTESYAKTNSLVRILKNEKHFNIDETANNVFLTDDGVTLCEEFLNVENLYANEHAKWVHHISQALKAHNLFELDSEYVVEDGQEGKEIVIVDEHTGRKMVGRRYSDGLHQAIEAKEGIKIRRENQTLASITFQNFFRMYNVLSGMTGTADTEAVEFDKIYSLGVTAIPTHKPIIRDDSDDQIYKSREEKMKAIIEDIKIRYEKGQPMLVGTISIEKSEELSALLTRNGVKHEVLNAKNHTREAEIIRTAGHLGRVTIATNMAGRGTDIVLGEGVAEVGGLHVLATERHESRRIDNQLRGRAGRQGDPGSSQFFLSLDDDLMRIFGGDRIKGLMDRMGAEEGEVITHGLVNRAIANAQKKVEGQNFESRKNLLEYDDVVNAQRKMIYKERRNTLEGLDVHEEIIERMEIGVDVTLYKWVSVGRFPEDWDQKGICAELQNLYGINYTFEGKDLAGMTAETLLDEVIDLVNVKYKSLEDNVALDDIASMERWALLTTVDEAYKDHLLAMDHLRDAIRFQGYAQKDPLVMYKKESKTLFEDCQENISSQLVRRLMNVQIKERDPEPEFAPAKINIPGGAEEALVGTAPRAQIAGLAMAGARQKVAALKAAGKEPGRNDACFCGSGKKYKKCCGIDN
jgi:preprotein translocase subunit SecA